MIANIEIENKLRLELLEIYHSMSILRDLEDKKISQLHRICPIKEIKLVNFL
tara:strand:- start:11203 stop:11358 length:156 start_codon:yes stop_codon:yes gene_type:complete